MRSILRLLLAGSLLGLVACGEASGPAPLTSPTASLTAPPGAAVDDNIVRQSAAAEPLRTLTATMWAVRGEDRRVMIDYDIDPVTAAACNCGTFVRLRIDRESLVNRPDGTPIAMGDSILITVTVDPVEFRATFSPAGLQFNPDKQPQLKFWYGRADRDFNRDGVVDDRDQEILDLDLGIWFRQNPTDEWTRLNSQHDPLREFFEVKLDHFSSYVVSW